MKENNISVKTLEKLKKNILNGNIMVKNDTDEKNYIEHLGMAIDELKKQRWIRTSDRLPGHMEIVSVSYKKYSCGTVIQGVTMGLRIDDQWEVLEPRSWEEMQNIEIVAWKPRPEEYQEES